MQVPSFPFLNKTYTKIKIEYNQKHKLQLTFFKLWQIWKNSISQCLWGLLPTKCEKELLGNGISSRTKQRNVHFCQLALFQVDLSELTRCSQTEPQGRLLNPCIASWNGVLKRSFILLEDKNLLGFLKHIISPTFPPL